MIYGYCRISTNKQSIERQVRNITHDYPTANIIKEIYTGTSIYRPEWQRLKNNLKDGDTIIFDAVDRMSRNADEGVSEYFELYKRGINLIFIKEPHINTTVYKKALETYTVKTGTAIDRILEGIDEYMRAVVEEQIRLAFNQAEKEVQDLRRRTSEGLLTAKLNGSQIGCKKGSTWDTKKSKDVKAKIIRYAKEYGGNLTDRDLIKLTGVSPNTYYKYKRELKN